MAILKKTVRKSLKSPCIYKPLIRGRNVSQKPVLDREQCPYCVVANTLWFRVDIASSPVDWQNDTLNNKSRQGRLQNPPCQTLRGRHNVSCGGQTDCWTELSSIHNVSNREKLSKLTYIPLQSQLIFLWLQRSHICSLVCVDNNLIPIEQINTQKNEFQELSRNCITWHVRANRFLKVARHK